MKKTSCSLLFTEPLGTERLHPTELVIDLNYPAKVSWLTSMIAKGTVARTCEFVKTPLYFFTHGSGQWK